MSYPHRRFVLHRLVYAPLAHLHGYLQFGNKPWYRHVCAVGAVFNMFMMMAANLVGFVIGTDGVSYMLQQLFGTTEGNVARRYRCKAALMFVSFRKTVPFVRVPMSLHRCASDVRVQVSSHSGLSCLSLTSSQGRGVAPGYRTTLLTETIGRKRRVRGSNVYVRNISLVHNANASL